MANTPNRPKQLALLLALLFLLAWALPAAAADVWVNTSTGVYHCPGGQYYGATKRGRFMSEREAAQHGYRAAYGRTCSPGEGAAGRQQVIQQLTQSATRTAPATATRVWINTGSHVYHCPARATTAPPSKAGTPRRPRPSPAATVWGTLRSSVIGGLAAY